MNNDRSGKERMLGRVGNEIQQNKFNGGETFRNHAENQPKY